MTKTYNVYSTLTNGQTYTATKPGPNNTPLKIGAVHIRGGANLPDKHVITRYGAMTKVTQEQMDILNQNHVFQRHVERGHITVSQRAENADTVAADMEGRDKSSPLVPQDYELGGENGGKAPIVNTKEINGDDAGAPAIAAANRAVLPNQNPLAKNRPALQQPKNSAKSATGSTVKSPLAAAN